MKNIRCILGLHKYSKWKIIKEGILECVLNRKCIKCQKIDNYVGMTEICIISGENFPYIMKH